MVTIDTLRNGIEAIAYAAAFDLPAVQIEKAGASFGLIGMRQRAEQIKGQITIESAKTQGTTVRLSIPIS